MELVGRNVEVCELRGLALGARQELLHLAQHLLEARRALAELGVAAAGVLVGLRNQGARFVEQARGPTDGL